MRISDWSSDVSSSDLNRAQRSTLRTALKKGKAAGATADEQRQAVSLLDRAARQGLIHRNTAARQNSRQIGRASCSERVCQDVDISVVVVSVRKDQSLRNILVLVPQTQDHDIPS